MQDPLLWVFCQVALKPVTSVGDLPQMLVYRFDDEEWENIVAKDLDWTREETDYLLSLCDLYDLRFFVIGDRYEVSVALATSSCHGVYAVGVECTAFVSCLLLNGPLVLCTAAQIQQANLAGSATPER